MQQVCTPYISISIIGLQSLCYVYNYVCLSVRGKWAFFLGLYYILGKGME